MNEEIKRASVSQECSKCTSCGCELKCRRCERKKYDYKKYRQNFKEKHPEYMSKYREVRKQIHVGTLPKESICAVHLLKKDDAK